MTHVAWDRDQPAPAELAGATYDAVVDVARHPSRVRSAVAARPTPTGSSCRRSASTPTTRSPVHPEVTPTHEPITEDVDLAENMEAYGPMKVACEQTVLAGAASADGDRARA